jgi:hypothetical protein
MRPNAEPSKTRCNKTGNFSNNGTKESKREKLAGRRKEIRTAKRVGETSASLFGTNEFSPTLLV